MFNAEQAKKEYVFQLEEEWRQNWRCQNHKGLGYVHPTDIPADKIPQPPDLAPKQWIIQRWETGGLVADYDKFCKLPKSQQNKILKTK